jgi:hypothetical protein
MFNCSIISFLLWKRNVHQCQNKILPLDTVLEAFDALIKTNVISYLHVLQPGLATKVLQRKYCMHFLFPLPNGCNVLPTEVVQRNALRVSCVRACFM